MNIQTIRTTLLALLVLTVQQTFANDLYIDPDGAQGRLVIVGGGMIPTAAQGQFVAWAGGRGAKILVVTTASEDAGTDQQDRFSKPWDDFDINSVLIVHAESREEASSKSFLKSLQ